MNTINWCTEHKQICRLNGDCQCFAKVKILWLRNWQLQPNLLRWFLWGIRCHAFGFFAFPAGPLVASWKSIEPPPGMLFHTNCPSAVPVEFHNYNDTGRSDGSGDDQRGRLSGRALVQRRPRVSKLGLKGLSRLVLQWDSSWGSQTGGKWDK